MGDIYDQFDNSKEKVNEVVGDVKGATTTVKGKIASIQGMLADAKNKATNAIGSIKAAALNNPVIASARGRLNDLRSKMDSTLNSKKVGDIKNTQAIDTSNQDEILEQVCEDLLEIEENIPKGGTHIVSYEKGKYEHIGVITNNTPPIRVDRQGKFRPKCIGIDSKGTFTINTAVPYSEAVENSRFPCGDYTLVVGNQFNTKIGAGGYNLTTLGNSIIASDARTTISSKEDLNISSASTVTIKSASCLDLEGDTMVLSTPDQVVVDATLGVAKNVIVNGSAMIDGELFVNHITAPAEVQYTGGGIGSFGQFMPSKGSIGNNVIGYADVSYIKKLLLDHGIPWTLPDKVPVLIFPDEDTPMASTIGITSGRNRENSIFIYPHEHPFRNIPLVFANGNESMRTLASDMNSGKVVTAGQIQHGYKGQPI